MNTSHIHIYSVHDIHRMQECMQRFRGQCMYLSTSHASLLCAIGGPVAALQLPEWVSHIVHKKYHQSNGEN